MRMKAVLLILIVACLYHDIESKHTNLVIIGGTGDLARKYLWQSALQLFVENYNENSTFSFYAGARAAPDIGSQALSEILENVVCNAQDSKCVKLRPEFLENTKFVQLKTEHDYAHLCEQFQSKYSPTNDIHQIFYLSVPSWTYQSISKNIHYNCRHGYISSTRVVLEKPFGEDKASAQKQADVIGQYFDDDEVRRVDHYLAKTVSKQILSFRSANRENLEALLTGEFVDRVEIVMKELIGVKGRIDFYDGTGVIRDVMQNHLTELLALVAMELPTNISDSNDVEKYKLRLLSQVTAIDKTSILIGQYKEYLNEAQGEIKNTTHSHLTPTFAAALLQVNSARWRHVPFVLMSGKHMDERTSHIRILFREREFCVSGCVDGNSTFTKYPRQLVFQIGHGPIPSAGILISRSLFKPNWPMGMNELSMTSKDSRIHGQSPGDFYYAVPDKEISAYTTVIRDLYHDVKETFVTANRVRAQWNIWDDVLREIRSTKPRLYKEYEAENLHFVVQGMKLKYITKDDENNIVDDQAHVAPNMAFIPNMFRNRTLVCKPFQNLISELASYIYSSAENAIKTNGVFHIALSGGRTPIALFNEIVTNFPLFPWPETHIWQVDERCVSQNSEQSNFLSIYSNLIKFIDIPYFNIHPMPVDFAGKICDPENKGDNLYENLINQIVPKQIFDLILLGLGSDGHTASLFPHSKHISESNRLVSLTSSKQTGTLDRMSLLPPLINSAREVIVLVTGAEKFEILNKIAVLDTKTPEYPITFISPEQGNLTWYVDVEAWTGFG